MIIIKLKIKLINVNKQKIFVNSEMKLGIYKFVFMIIIALKSVLLKISIASNEDFIINFSEHFSRHFKSKEKLEKFQKYIIKNLKSRIRERFSKKLFTMDLLQIKDREKLLSNLRNKKDLLKHKKLYYKNQPNFTSFNANDHARIFANKTNAVKASNTTLNKKHQKNKKRSHNNYDAINHYYDNKTISLFSDSSHYNNYNNNSSNSNDNNSTSFYYKNKNKDKLLNSNVIGNRHGNVNKTETNQIIIFRILNSTIIKRVNKIEYQTHKAVNKVNKTINNIANSSNKSSDRHINNANSNAELDNQNKNLKQDLIKNDVFVHFNNNKYIVEDNSSIGNNNNTSIQALDQETSNKVNNTNQQNNLTYRIASIRNLTEVYKEDKTEMTKNSMNSYSTELDEGINITSSMKHGAKRRKANTNLDIFDWSFGDINSHKRITKFYINIETKCSIFINDTVYYDKDDYTTNFIDHLILHNNFDSVEPRSIYSNDVLINYFIYNKKLNMFTVNFENQAKRNYSIVYEYFANNLIKLQQNKKDFYSKAEKSVNEFLWKFYNENTNSKPLNLEVEFYFTIDKSFLNENVEFNNKMHMYKTLLDNKDTLVFKWNGTLLPYEVKVFESVFPMIFENCQTMTVNFTMILIGAFFVIFIVLILYLLFSSIAKDLN